MDNVRIFVVVIGLSLSIIFLFYFIQSSSPLDLFWVSLGLVLMFCGVYIADQKITENKIAYVGFCGVNVLQWGILIYIYFFNQVYMTMIFYLMLIAVSLFTINLIGEFFNIPLFSFNKDKKDSKNVISGVTWNWKQIVLVLLGIIVIFACLIIFFLFKSFLALYFCPIGIMMVIYGYYLEINKIKMSFNYLTLMVAVILFQYTLAVFMRNIHVIFI
jgi:hypothetical protein